MTRRLHARHVGLHLLRRPRRHHRPQRRHRLGLHQPRSRRHRPLPREDRRRRPLRPRRRPPSRWQVRTETIKVRGEDDVELQVRETVHGPLISDVSSRVRDRRRQRPDRRARRAGGNGYAVALAWTALEPGTHRRRDPGAQPGVGLGRVPRRRRRLRRARAEPRLRRPRGPHRLPVARAGSRSARRQRRHGCRSRAGSAPTTGPATTSRSTACRACSTPRRASSSPPTRRSSTRDYPYLLTEDWDCGYRSTRIREVLERGGRAVGRRDGRAAARHDQPDGRDPRALPARRRDLPNDYYRDGQQLLRRLGLHLARRQRAPRPTTTSCGATCSS